MNALLYLVFFGLTALASGAGAYFGSYLKKKGENLATHEDIDKLLEQVSAVTKTTKEIEAKISDDVWSRQKHWELKRDVLFDVAKGLGSIVDALTDVFAVYETDSKSTQTEKENPARSQKRIEAIVRFNDAANQVDQTVSLVALVCGDEVKRELHGFGLFHRRLSQKITAGQPDAFMPSLSELVARREKIIALMRKEMGIEPEPSAKPSPPTALPT
jgi:hypothetical protein